MDKQTDVAARSLVGSSLFWTQTNNDKVNRWLIDPSLDPWIVQKQIERTNDRTNEKTGEENPETYARAHAYK